jgi:hypothetical protein
MVMTGAIGVAFCFSPPAPPQPERISALKDTIHNIAGNNDVFMFNLL